jgi:hypothetical protein
MYLRLLALGVWLWTASSCVRGRAEACDVSCELLVSCGQPAAASRLACDDAGVLPKCSGIHYDECPLCLAEKRCSDFDGGNPCPSSCPGLTP